MLLCKVFSYGWILKRVRLREELPFDVEFLRSLLMALNKLLFVQKIKIQRTFQVAFVMETVASVSITGKFETLGSNFSQEIRRAKLLASIATIPKVRCILILLKLKITFS